MHHIYDQCRVESSTHFIGFLDHMSHHASIDRKVQFEFIASFQMKMLNNEDSTVSVCMTFLAKILEIYFLSSNSSFLLSNDQSEHSFKFLHSILTFCIVI